MGVAKIVWHFTQDIRQAIAGLFHDIATPAFAHTIDFLHGDHLAQESTEDATASFIMRSKEIVALLNEHSIDIGAVCDYHIYPIADNDTPMLSADRLEYTLGNGFCVYNADAGYLQAIYSDLIVAQNEDGSPELCFRSMDAAREFTAISLRNSRLFVSDEDRFSMQYLADTVRFAAETGVLNAEDLYLTEGEVIAKFLGDKRLSEMWEKYREVSSVATSPKKLEDRYCVNVSAKKRYIDPLVMVKDSAKRISALDTDVGERIQAFLNLDFNKWIYTRHDA